MSNVTDTDAILFKRQNKGRVHKDITKRVSFNEDALDEHKIKELRVLSCIDDDIKPVTCDYELKKEFINSCEEAENCDKCDTDKTQYSVFSNFKFNYGKESNNTPVHSTPKAHPVSQVKRHSATDKRDFPPFFERGAPEGQEDPRKYSSLSNLSDFGNESCSSKETSNTYDYASRKAQSLLVRRFLQSLSHQKQNHAKRCVPLHAEKRVTYLYYKNVKKTESSDHSVLTKLISDEILSNVSVGETWETSPTLNPLVEQLVSDGKEFIYKVYKVLNVDGSPSLAVITKDSLCFLSYCQEKKDYIVEFWCCFGRLAAAVLGPFSQIVIFLNEEKDRFLINTGLSDSLCSEFISHLEVSVRRWCASKNKEFVFNVAQIHSMKHMKSFYDILPDNAFNKDEVLIAQYSVWLQEDYVGSSSSPLGPQKDGYLMTKIGVGASWMPSYIYLNGGILYVFEKFTTQVPKFAIPLRSTFYKGCRIHNNAERPHSFEILLEEGSNFHFGAADEVEMMEWIQALYSSASQVSSSNNLVDCHKEPQIRSCFATLTTSQIMLHQFPNNIISRALLEDISDFKKSIWPHNYFCLLELNCREASEMGGDWILYFVSQDSFNNFCEHFTTITHRTGIETQFDESRFFANKSDRICAQIRSSWDSFFVHNV